MKNSLGRMGVGLASAAIATMSLSGCATTARLDARFDTDTVGSPPSTYPSPSPPNDVLTYTGTYVTATVEPDPPLAGAGCALCQHPHSSQRPIFDGAVSSLPQIYLRQTPQEISEGISACV
jgi:hypothetical protein